MKERIQINIVSRRKMVFESVVRETVIVRKSVRETTSDCVNSSPIREILKQQVTSYTCGLAARCTSQYSASPGALAVHLSSS